MQQRGFTRINHLEDTYDIERGYEAGCLGYSLYNQLTAFGVKCVILAPTTMLTQQGQRIKTAARDAHMIAQCLFYGGYHAVYIHYNLAIAYQSMHVNY